MAIKATKAPGLPNSRTSVITNLPLKAAPRAGRLLAALADLAARVIPPALVLALVLLV